LKIILGHLGSFTWWLWRLDSRWIVSERGKHRSPLAQKKPSQYIKENFYVTTSGMFWHRHYNVAIGLGADRVLFAVDHPYESTGMQSNLWIRHPYAMAIKKRSTI